MLHALVPWHGRRLVPATCLRLKKHDQAKQSIGISWDFMGFYGISWQFHGNFLWDFLAISQWTFMVISQDFMGYDGMIWVRQTQFSDETHPWSAEIQSANGSNGLLYHLMETSVPKKGDAQHRNKAIIFALPSLALAQKWGVPPIITHFRSGFSINYPEHGTLWLLNIAIEHQWTSHFFVIGKSSDFYHLIISMSNLYHSQL